MSTVEPGGTWQYAQAVALPAGARDGSHAAYWTNSTYGRSGWRPAATSASLAAISSSVPPRWTVAGPARTLGGPRDRAVERPVDLEHARAVAESLGSPAAPWRQPVAGDRHELARRDVEQDGTRRRQVGERVDPMTGHHLAARRLELGDQRLARRRPPRRGPSAIRPRARTWRGPARTRHSTGDRG